MTSRQSRGPWSVLLTVLCLAATLTACRSDPQALPPQPGVDVLAYDVRLAVDPAARIVGGTVRLTVRHPPTTGTLALRFDAPDALRTLRVDDLPVEGTRDGGVLRVPLPADTLSVVEVGYVLEAPRDGLFVEDALGQVVLVTDSQFLRGASWLPAVHHPADPATLTLALTVPDTLEVVAAGTPVAARDTFAEPGFRRWVFETDAAVPTYTFAFAVADFATTEQSVTLPSVTLPTGTLPTGTLPTGTLPTGAPSLGTSRTVPIRHHLLAADSAAARWLVRTPEALAYFDSTLGPYAFDSYATAQVPIPFAGMENAATAFLRYDLYGQTYRGANVVEEVNVHEVAHMWFGNRVTIAAYRDLWLSEGLVSYLTTVFYEALDGPGTGRKQRLRLADFGGSSDLFDARQPLVPDTVTDPMDLIGATVYLKGGCVAHLLRLTVSDDAFFRALRRTYAEYGLRQRPLSTEAFQTILEEESAQDLDAFFAYWVYGDQVPTLRARWDDTTGTLAWTVEGDAGTLDGLALELLIEQGDVRRYVPLGANRTTLPGDRLPSIRPVGVPLRMR